jgi:hypothetical protein
MRCLAASSQADAEEIEVGTIALSTPCTCSRLKLPVVVVFRSSTTAYTVAGSRDGYARQSSSVADIATKVCKLFIVWWHSLTTFQYGTVHLVCDTNVCEHVLEGPSLYCFVTIKRVAGNNKICSLTIWLEFNTLQGSGSSFDGYL